MTDMDDIAQLRTEQPNPVSRDIDTKSALEIIRIINAEDKKVPLAVEAALPDISRVVDMVAAAFRRGGRLFYVGAGSSGRLGVLDASECSPTFGVPHDTVQGIIAGGSKALVQSVEWAEDDENAGRRALDERGVGPDDVVIGITASGRAPFVIGAMKRGRELGAGIGALGCNRESRIFSCADHRIFVDAGPEIIAGSTRMKAGTAQKLVLNMITTAAMIRMGKVYNNLMVDLVPVNKKLVKRSIGLIMSAAGCTRAEAEDAFEASGHHPKTAIVSILAGIDSSEARDILTAADGRVGDALERHRRDSNSVERIIERHLGRTFPGVALRITQGGCILHEIIRGEGIARDTLFDLASLTKPLAAAAVFLSLCRELSISIDSPIGAFLSEPASHLRTITPAQLMTHTAGLPPVPDIFRLFRDDTHIDRDRALRHLYTLPPAARPGTRVIYSCTGYILLTRIIEHLAGDSLSRTFAKLITAPAGINGLVFNPRVPEKCAPTGYCRWRGRMLRGEVHDENARCFAGEGGNAGLFGTLEGVDTLVRSIQDGLKGVSPPIIPVEYLRLMTCCRTGTLRPRRTAGFLAEEPDAFPGGGFSSDSYGHTGFTGTSVWVDPLRDLRVIVLTNRVHYGREKTADAIRVFRGELHQALLSPSA